MNVSVVESPLIARNIEDYTQVKLEYNIQATPHRYRVHCVVCLFVCA